MKLQQPLVDGAELLDVERLVVDEDVMARLRVALAGQQVERRGQVSVGDAVSVEEIVLGVIAAE